ncbi:MAG: glycosyltransferase family 1 protein, partial [Chryseobacterium sp.]
MKIVINTRLLRKGHMDGIGWFTFNTLQHIVKWNPQIEFHFLFDSGVEKEFLFGENVTGHNLFPPAKHALLNVAWFEWSARRVLNKLEPDLFFSPDGILCLGWKGKQYGVIHDVNYVHRPKDLKWSNRTYYNTLFPKYAKRAARIGTVSEYSKQDIVQTFGVDPKKIDVVYSGINSFYKPISEVDKLEARNKFAGGDEYFVFVSTLHPRKNIIGMLEAFEQFKSGSSSKVKLVIAGKGM